MAAELERKSAPVHAADTHDEPSVAWGWHGHFPRAAKIAGWGSVVIMLSMLIGNHEGWNEDIYLIVIAAIMAGLLIRQHIKDRTSWRD